MKLSQLLVTATAMFFSVVVIANPPGEITGQVTEDTVVRKNRMGSLEFTDFGAGPSDLADVFWFAEYPLSLGGVRTVSDHNDFSASRLYERALFGLGQRY